MENTGLLVYCIANENVRSFHEIMGLDGVHPLDTVEKNGLFAVVSKVALSEYGEESLNEKSEDVAWLTEKARAFMDIMLRVCEKAPSVPMKFLTIFTAEDRVISMLEEHREVFDENFMRIKGREEWSVKIYCDDRIYKAHVMDKERAAFEKSIEGKPKGAAFFLKKKFETELDERVHDRICEVANSMSDSLSSLSSGMKAGKLLAKEISGVEIPMVLNCAFLLDSEQKEAFIHQVEELGKELKQSGFEITCTGPWPPYSFCELDE